MGNIKIKVNKWPVDGVCVCAVIKAAAYLPLHFVINTKKSGAAVQTCTSWLTLLPAALKILTFQAASTSLTNLS